MSNMRSLICFLLFIAAPLIGFSQSEDLSLAELKTQYLKKRSSFASSSTKVITTEQQTELNTLVAQLKSKDAESFEYNLILWINGNYNTALQENLFKAYALNAADETVVREMLGFYLITSNLAKQKDFLTKVQKHYTAAELAYYQDAMPTTKSILVSSNQEDMYGFLIAQTAFGKGTDVQVINLDFMKNESYREMVSNNSGITDVTFLGNEKNYLKTMLGGSAKKIFISATVPQEYLSSVSDKIYLTGLSYQYGNIDQFAALNDFWKKMKSKDLTQITLSKSAESKLYGNYLPPLLTLYMMQPGDALLKTTIRSIAEKVGKTAEVDDILKEIDAG